MGHPTLRKVLRAAGIGLLGSLIARVLIYLGLPLDGIAHAIATFLLGARHAVSAEVALWSAVGIVGLALGAIEWWWEPLERLYRRFRPIETERYLADRDTELSTAVMVMVLKSAWGKWYRSQFPPEAQQAPFHDQSVMNVATGEVTQAAMDGKLEIRGRPKGATEYEPISRAVWRLGTLSVEPNKFTIWKVKAVCRHDVPPQRIAALLNYDSLIVDAEQFQTLWPGGTLKT